MVKTRTQAKKSYSRKRSMRRSYKRHMKKSLCKGIGRARCASMKECKYVNGKKRRYCRKGKGQSVRSRRQVLKLSDVFRM